MRKKLTIKDVAEINGVATSTAYQRIAAGWTPKDAVSTPPNSSPKADRVWKYLIDNPSAKPKQVSEACGVSYGYAHQLHSKIGTPPNVRERQAKFHDTSTDTAPKTNWSMWVGGGVALAAAFGIGTLV